MHVKHMSHHVEQNTNNNNTQIWFKNANFGVHYYKGRLCVMMLRGKELFYGEDVFTVLVPEKHKNHAVSSFFFASLYLNVSEAYSYSFMFTTEKRQFLNLVLCVAPLKQHFFITSLT